MNSSSSPGAMANYFVEGVEGRQAGDGMKNEITILA
jgi:hypothetical protein